MNTQDTTRHTYPLSIVIPVCNEAVNVSIMVNEILTHVVQKELEIIFVDDGSTDATWSNLQQLVAKHPQVKAYKHTQNAGQSVALITGINHASYPWVVTLDGDGQNDPADIPHLVEAHRKAVATDPNNQHIILGVRHIRQDNGLRRLSTKIARFVRKLCLNDDCPDSGCATKIFHQDHFRVLPTFKNMHRFLPVLFVRAGFKTHLLNVNHRPRQHGTTKYGVMNRLWPGIFDLIGVIWLLRRPTRANVESAS